MQNIKRKRKEVLHVKENFLARKGKKKILYLKKKEKISSRMERKNLFNEEETFLLIKQKIILRSVRQWLRRLFCLHPLQE